MRKILGGFAIALALTSAREAAAICREVHDPDSPPPVIEPVQAVYVAKRTGVPVGENCPPPPGEDTDAGPPPDAGPCEPVLGDVVSMVVQPRFEIGPEGSSFALLMVTPASPVIEVAAHDFFSELANATAPEVVIEQVEVEDVSLGYQCCDPHYGGSPSYCGESGGGYGYGGGSSFGCGAGGAGSYEDDDSSWDGTSDAGFTPPGMDGGVAIETIGAYEVVRVSSTDRTELAGWLDTYGYVYTQADLDAVEPYMAAGWTVIAVRVALDHAHDGGLEPLSFTWLGTEVRLPLGISRQPSFIHYPLTVYVEAETRYEMGGGRVAYARRGPQSFLTRLELDVDPWAAADYDPIAAVVPEVEQQDTVTVEQEIHIPSSQCPMSNPPPPPRNDDDRYGCCDAGGRDGNFVLLIAAVILGMPRRRRH